MDRSVLESDPHAVLEGMIIAGYAIGADHGYIYVRAEYPKAIERLNIAIAQAQERGFLGDAILGSTHSFHIKLKEGAGAFVCGEETALMMSIEGKRGMPRVRPPFPATKGLWEKPTSINNVETFANVPWIIINGAKAFNSLGTANSKGTKVFAMAGKIRHGGLVEVPMGISIREIVYDICGGIRDDRKFKAVQMGGPSGGCIPAELQDTVIDYESINKTGAIMGSGGLVVMDDDDLHGGRRPVLPRVHPARIVRQVHVLPDRHQADARGADAHHRGQGARRRHRAARGAGRPDEELVALRPRPDGAEPGADDAEVLPVGVRGAHHATRSARRTTARSCSPTRSPTTAAAACCA